MIKEEFLLVDECDEEDSDQATSSFDPNLEQDVKAIVEKLCDEIVRTETQDEFVEATTPGGFTIKVTKRVADIAAHFGFNPFSYIRVEPLSLPKSQSVNVNRQRKYARSSSEESANNDEFEPSTKRIREDLNKKVSRFKPKRMKCITENCKVCLAPMDQRTFMPDGETFYCSTECIHRKVKQVRKNLTTRDQIFVTDRKGRLHANYVPDIDSLEAFLLRRPNYEPCVRQNEEDYKASPPSMSSTADDSRVRIRTTFSDQILKRCSFHDIEITEKRAKELSHQVEYDLFEFLKSVRDVRYRNWCRGFLKFLMNSTSVFLEKILNGSIDTARLVRIPDRILDSELHKMDEIEAAVEPSVKSEEPSPSPAAPSPVVETKPKPSPLSFPFKYRAEPLKPNTTVKPKPVETGKSAIDDILGTNKDTTSKHMSHLYDANCEICKKNSEMESAMLEKVKKSKQEKEREKDVKRNGNKEELVIKKTATYTRKTSRFEDSSTLKQQVKTSSFNSRRKYSDDDNSPPSGGFDDDFIEPPPPGHSPDFSRDLHRPPIKPSSTNPIPDSGAMNNSTFDSNRNRRRSRSPVSPLYRAPLTRPQLSAIDSNRISPVEFRRESWRESWRQPDNRPRMSPEQDSLIVEDELKLIWSGIFDFPRKYRYKCEFSLVKNLVASNDLRQILPDMMRVQGSIEYKVVWSYLESLRSAWTKDVITLLMHPPTDNAEYQMYVNFYTYLEESKRMAVVDVKRCLEIKDIYLFALPPFSSLHPSCDVGDGPGLSSHIQNCGNILAVVVRQKKTSSKANQDDLLTSGKSRVDSAPLKRPLSREDYQMEILSNKRINTPTQSPFAERSIRMLPEERNQQFLNFDIPIVAKSPFDSNSEKSPTTSAHSLHIEESVQDNDVEMELIPPPPPIFHPNDVMESNSVAMEMSPDAMEMSSDEDGELQALTPPPIAPVLLNPVVNTQFNRPPAPIPAPVPPPIQRMPFPMQRPQGIPPPPNVFRGPNQRIIRGAPPIRRPMLRLNGPANNAQGSPRGRMPMRMPMQMQGVPPPRMQRLSDANIQGQGPPPTRARMPTRMPMQRPNGPPRMLLPGPPQRLLRGMPMRRPMLRAPMSLNQVPRMPPPRL